MHVDAADPLEGNLARYMNHAEVAPNCLVVALYEPDIRVLIFAGRDVAIGEELCWDYGPAFWAGRETQKIKEPPHPWWMPSWAPWAPAELRAPIGWNTKDWA